MSYATKYEYVFNSQFTQLPCKVELQLDGFIGSPQAIKGAGTSPCVLTRQGGDDSVFEAVRATTCVLTCVGVSITEFQSANNLDWRVVVSYNGAAIFYGFISQEDTSEAIQFAPNAVQITATDGLALLRDVPYNETLFGTFTSDTSIYNAILWAVTATGLNLPINFFGNLWTTGMNEGAGFAWANQVFFRLYFFEKQEDVYKSAYEVLEELLSSMCARLYQANGQWVIDRPSEVEQYPAGIPGSRFVWTSGLFPDTVSDVTLSTVHSTLVPVNRSQIKTAIRPAKAVTRQYEYKSPILLRNANFSKLGALLGTFTDGPNTVSRYALVDWTVQNSGEGEIRVVKDTVTGVEVDRYLFIKYTNSNPVGSASNAIVSNVFPIEEGDKFALSFTYNGTSNTNTRDSFRYTIANNLTAGAYYLLRVSRPDIDGFFWTNSGISAPFGFNNMPATLSNFRGGTLDATESVTINLENLPSDGNIPNFLPTAFQMKLLFHAFTNNSSNEANIDCIMRDIIFNYTFYVNKSLVLRGQQHNTSIATDYKKAIDQPLHIDDSPKLLSLGALYTGSFVKTTLWSTAKGGTKNKRFGQINTEALHQVEAVTRQRVEGEFIGLPIAPGVFTFGFMPGKKFLEGTLSLDLAAGLCSGVWFEVVGDTVPAIDYTFNYLYNE